MRERKQKNGKACGRLDLYARLGRSREKIQREVKRLTGRIDRTELMNTARFGIEDSAKPLCGIVRQHFELE